MAEAAGGGRKFRDHQPAIIRLVRLVLTTFPLALFYFSLKTLSSPFRLSLLLQDPRSMAEAILQALEQF